MSIFGRLHATTLARRARTSEDSAERAALLVQAAASHGTAERHLEAAAALAAAGRLAASAQSWRQALARDPLQLPSDAQLAALSPVLPLVAVEVRDALLRGTTGWTLQRRGCFAGEERWRLEQARHDSMDALLPTLRYLALVIAHTSPVPGRLRIDCDWQNDDSEAYLALSQLGEALFSWDEARRVSALRHAP
jgi:hypothetical protein